MSAVECPQGHASATADYCDQCGARITGAAAVPCPGCGAPGGAQFCEACGYDFAAAQPRAAAVWEVVVRADPEHFARVAAELEFPVGAAPRIVALDEPELSIGRSSRTDAPEIALDDPAVSHRHARLSRADDGSYAIADLGSTNGTTRNDDALAPNTLVALCDGDRIHLGAWTEIAVRVVRHD